jgi:serine protease Do
MTNEKRMTNDQCAMTNEGHRGDRLQFEVSDRTSLIGHWSLVIGHLLFVATLATAGPPDEVLQIEQQRIAAIAKASEAFIAVFANEGNGGGSGVVISPDGYALTNFHVAKPAGNHSKCGMKDGRLYDAVLVGLDPTGDTALIKLLGRDDFPAATLADSDALKVGDWCFAVGNPFLLATDFQPTVTYGLVSGVHRCQYPAGTLLEYTDAIQTDASINPGNSGGPLFNAAGDLIGIVGSGSFDKRGRVNVGVGYAISINQVKNFLGCLKSGRLVDHATLGATVSTDDQGRVRVNNILDTSDAFRRGLRFGDEIVKFGGRRITSANGFKSALGTFPKGWSVPLTYRRDGREQEITVRLAGLLTPEELNDKATKAFGEDKPKLPMPKPGEKPKPGDKEKPEAKPPEQPQKTETPKEIAALIDPRPGFANYHFNREQRDRVWNAIKKSTASFPAALNGKLASGALMEIELGDQTSSGKFPSGNVAFSLDEDVDQQLGPPNTGGLVAALHLLRLFLAEGPEKYGDVYYYGTKPIKLGAEQYDVLIATRNVAELHVWTEPSSGKLVRVELFVDDEQDPCELHFTDDQIEVHHGGKMFGTLELSSAKEAAR